ncbi:hypothetical protein GW17_00013330 [Ensete ventricosum]|nr:hypothetical protein GW17_00013330 [Ensete ventricosum]
MNCRAYGGRSDSRFPSDDAVSGNRITASECARCVDTRGPMAEGAVVLPLPPHRLLVKMPRPSSATLFQSRRSHAPRRRNTRSTRSMAENCCGLDPWTYRPHACISEAVFARENDALTKALQISLLSDAAASSSSSAVPSRDSTSLAAASFLLPFAPDLPRGRDPPSGRIAKKRKSRATNRSLTTYITADPANFRQLVQQVTGTGPLDGAGLPVDLPTAAAAAAVLQGSCLLPTLDTSAFFLDRVGAVDAPVLAEFDSSLAAPSFPTLDSWAVI